MKVKIELDESKEYFNATLLLKLHNSQVKKPQKRMYNYTDNVSAKALMEVIERNNKSIGKPRRAVYPVGGKHNRHSWMHVALMPHFLHWVCPYWYVEVFQTTKGARYLPIVANGAFVSPIVVQLGAKAA